MKTTLLLLLLAAIAGSVMAQKKPLDTAGDILNNKLKFKVDSDLLKSPAFSNKLLNPNLSSLDQLNKLNKGNMLTNALPRFEANANSSYNMPIAKLKGNSKMPIAKLEGNSKMPVLGKNLDALKVITKVNP
ncbi:MAG: hypothetical protein JWP67_2301 [Mucilaginibacter sp.]|nr:hypothetical protein [Mucilaginibacter sp.]